MLHDHTHRDEVFEVTAQCLVAGLAQREQLCHRCVSDVAEGAQDVKADRIRDNRKPIRLRLSNSWNYRCHAHLFGEPSPWNSPGYSDPVPPPFVSSGLFTNLNVYDGGIHVEMVKPGVDPQF